MDRREVGARRNAAALELADRPIAYAAGGETYHVDEPAHARRPRREPRCGHTLDVREPFVVPTGDARALGDQLVEALHLDGAERRRELVEAIIVTEPAVREPAVEHVAPLIAEAAEEPVPLSVRRDEHTALAGRHRLVRVEGEHTRVGESAGGAALVGGANRLARVLDDGETVAAGDGENRIHVGGLAEDVHRDDGLEPSFVAAR